MIKTAQSKLVPILIVVAILVIVLPQQAQEKLVGDIDSLQADSLPAVSDSLDSLYLTSDSLFSDSLYTFSDSLALDSLYTLADSIAIEDSVAIDSIYYKADSVFYYVQKERIKLSGNAFLRYQGATISSDTISVDMKEQQASSQGQALMKEGAHQLLGEEIHFDIENQTGLIAQGATKFDKGYYYGKEVRKVGKEVFDIDSGYFTTCDSEEPHYYIFSRDMRMYKDDKIVAKPVVFYVNHFPVLALPFATFTIKRGRQTGFLVAEPGYNSSDGKYLKNIAYFIAFSDYADVTAALDYMEKTGWESRVNGRYNKQYDFHGDYLTRLKKRNGGLGSSDTYEWLIESNHHHDLGYQTTFDSDLYFISNKNILDNSDDINERLKESIKSSMTYKTPLFDRTLSVHGSYSEDLVKDLKKLTLPSISYSLPSKPVYELFLDSKDIEEKEDDDDEDSWWEPLSYSYSFDGAHTGTITEKDPDLRYVLWKNHKDSTGTYISEHHAGIHNSAGLNYSWKAFGWLSLSQSVKGNAIIIDRGRNSDELAGGYDYSTTSKASFSMYGTRQMPEKYISGVRHIFTPSVSFTYKPDFTENEDLYSFGSVYVNSGGKSRTISYALNNTWQIKLRGKDDEKEKKLNDFVSTSSRLTYNMEKEGKKFSNITHSISFKPASADLRLMSLNWYNSGSVTQDAYNFDVDYWKLSSKLTLSGDAPYTDYFPEPLNRFETSKFFVEDSLTTEDDSPSKLDTIEKIEELADTENWKITVDHDYSKYVTSDRYTSNLRITSSFRVTQNWIISYDNQIDLKESEFVSHSLLITRMLHCWKLTFKWEKSGDYWDYRLTLFAIKLPDALKFRTSDNKH